MRSGRNPYRGHEGTANGRGERGGIRTLSTDINNATRLRKLFYSPPLTLSWAMKCPYQNQQVTFDRKGTPRLLGYGMLLKIWACHKGTQYNVTTVARRKEPPAGGLRKMQSLQLQDQCPDRNYILLRNLQLSVLIKISAKNFLLKQRNKSLDYRLATTQARWTLFFPPLFLESGNPSINSLDLGGLLYAEKGSLNESANAIVTGTILFWYPKGETVPAH